MRSVDVLVVGAGPAGLTAAAGLARAGAIVEVVEREATAGGIPRHSFHTGYGVRDLRRVLTGPDYARRLVELATGAGVSVRTGVSVTGWSGPLALDTVSGQGIEQISARAVVLATGARERPRAARWVPGSRAAGVFTTGLLQQQVYLHPGLPVGRRAVVVGAEHVSYSALVTLRHAGVEVVALVTDQPGHQTWPALHTAARLRYATPVLTGVRVTNLVGGRRIDGVEIEAAGGRRSVIACDTVVFTGDWIPDHELARRAGLAIDPGSLGPEVDSAFRTDRPGVFAIGNLVHPVETADVCALDGSAVVPAVLACLRSESPPAASVPLRAAEPLHWVWPNRLVAGERPRRIRLWASARADRPEFVMEQAGRQVAQVRGPRRMVANRPFSIDAAWAGDVRSGAGPVTVRLGVD